MRRFLPWTVALSAKVVLDLWLLSLGLRALSDDDFARVQIAQSFAAAPSFNPSGTSWLPFPFWWAGALMAPLGATLTSARLVAALTGLASLSLLYVAARWTGAERWAAALGALLASAFPYAALLGVTTTPEALTAALAILGIAGLAATDGSRRWLGAGALWAATLSRYEAWPIAVVVAFWALRPLLQRRDLLRAVPPLLPITGPLSWSLLGWFQHGSPWFYLARVATYRRALGQGGGESWQQALLSLGREFARPEPELLVLGTLVLLWGAGGSQRRAAARPFTAPLLATLAFLALGRLSDGAATHHPERSFFIVWTGLALFAGMGLATAAQHWRRPAPLLLFLASGAVAASLRLGPCPFPSWGNRDEEEGLARSLVNQLPRDTRIGVYTGDYGFLAITAAVTPALVPVELRSVDPRRRPATEATLEELAATAKALGASHLIVPKPLAPTETPLIPVAASSRLIALGLSDLRLP